MDTGSSVDPREVEYYSRLADQWWDANGAFWPLHRLNKLRSAFIVRELSRHFSRGSADKPLRGLNVLDIGCGGGILSEAIARQGAHVHGIDVVEHNVAVAQHRAARNDLSVRYNHITAERLAATGCSYDVVLNMEVVEHVTDVPGFMAASARMVRRDGVMFVSTINRTPASWLAAIVGAEYVLRWLPRGTHRWNQFLKPEEVEGLLTNEGLTIARRVGVAVNPFNRRFSLSRFTPVNYMVMAVRELAGELQDLRREAA